MRQYSWVGHGQLWHILRLPSCRFFLYAICACAYLMAHPVVAANVTEADGNSKKASTNGTGPGEDEQIWGFFKHKPGPCADHYNELLKNSTEYNKAASSAASTITGLLPALLAFSPLGTVKIGLLRAVSNSHGFFAAVFTFGLPVEQLDTTRSVTVKELCGNIEDALPTAPPPTSTPVLQSVNNSTPTNNPLATPNSDAQEAIELIPLGGSSSPSSNPVEGIPTQQCVNPSASNGTVETAFELIRQEAFSYPPQKCIPVKLILPFYSFWHLFVGYFLISIMTAIDISTLIWACPGPRPHTIAWLVAVICIVGPSRAGYESRAFAATEAIHISMASRTMETGIAGYLKRLWDPQPMILILRPSPSATRGLHSISLSSGITMLRRLLQLCWLLLLSFFFSATVGGGLFSSLATVWLFVLAVAGSRFTSLLTLRCFKGLKVIEYDSPEELGMMRRCIGALPKARVEVREAFSSWLDFNGNDWRECIESYRQGQHEGHRNTVHGATHTICEIHAHKPGHQWLEQEAIPMVCIVLIILLLNIVPIMGVSSVGWYLAPFFVTAMVSIMNWERWIALCNCGIDDAQSA